MTGYLRSPAIHGDEIVFVSDDDLWRVDAAGGRADRLTSGVAESSGPRISRDGRHIAFVGRDEGAPDVYVMPMAGGGARRLTYLGGLMVVAGFAPDGAIMFATDAERPFYRDRWLYRVDPDGGAPTMLPYGPASVIDYGSGGAVVIARVTIDPAHWKRYRGGRVGELWIDATGSGEFRRLIKPPGNVATPCFIGDRVYFISDHEGVGNVYSCTMDGADLRRHTHHDDYYARGLAGDGHRLVYHSGADIWLLDPSAGEPRKVSVGAVSGATQRNRQFVPAAEHIDTVTVSPDGARLALTARGKAFAFGHFAGPVRQFGEPDGVRYRLLTYLHGGTRLVGTASDESETERLVVFDESGATALTGVDTGRATEIAASPSEDVVAVSNHRNELMVIDLRAAAPTARVADSSRFGRIEDLTWSADGGWLAYTFPNGPRTTAIKVLRIADGTTQAVTTPVLRDRRPAFDPLGRYLYFIGQRGFDPVYDELQFEMGFPLGSRPFAVTLRADEPAPFLGEISAPGGKAGDNGGGKGDNGAANPDGPDAAAAAAGTAPADAAVSDAALASGGGDDATRSLTIDLVGIDRRVVPLPVPDGRYERIAGTAEKVLFTSHPVVGVRTGGGYEPPGDNRTLQACTLATSKVDQIADGITDFWLGPDHKTLLYRAKDRLRVVAAGEKPADGNDPGRETGWIDLDRVKVSVRPGAEWPQMFREAWRLQHEQFWDLKMSSLDWDAVYRHYAPLVERVSSRSELSDLLWELQGELGTSHAYEAGGAYRKSPQYRQGFLGVDWAYDAASGDHTIGHIVVGDAWSPSDSSPLVRPGLDVRDGDAIVSVNGIAVDRLRTPASLLVNQADQEVEVAVRRGDGPVRTLRVRPIGTEQFARYREWVSGNRNTVHERTDGRVGYVHIPDMTAWGYAEFLRGFLAEFDHEALIVDVRFNRGGHVSGLLLQKLARRRLGYGFPRWGVPEPYPDEAARGPMVMLTNEAAGSDGDIVSHAFKQMGLGPLIGRRTWGGVIGIWPRHPLSDGTVTTQPEFAFAFDNVGWGVENYGTDPDIEVENRPQDFARGVDAQLERGIAEALAALEREPAHTPVAPSLPDLTRLPLPDVDSHQPANSPLAADSPYSAGSDQPAESHQPAESDQPAQSPLPPVE
ncbi:MAG TPA: S41 family peptidase [Micromonosporaceae bacterium]|nr:S41 family peptidase [Micromonosporaceae bacterium]